MADNSPCPTLMFHIPHQYHYFAKPGDARWKCIVNYVDAVGACKGRFYCICPIYGIGLMEPEKMLVTPLNVRVQYKVYGLTSFVTFGSDLCFRDRTAFSADTFKVDLESNTIVKFDNNDLEDYVLTVAYYGQPVMVPSQKSYRQLQLLHQEDANV